MIELELDPIVPQEKAIPTPKPLTCAGKSSFT
jgi:hypothetical protein